MNHPFASPETASPGPGYLQSIGHIENQVRAFGKINLQEMDAVQLQNRMDTKLIFHLDLLPLILNKMKDDYLVFEINNFRLNPYNTLYFDDADWKLYLLHHNEKLNRFKIRYRNYVSSNLSFFEIKYKNNKGRTIKERIKVPEIAATIDGKAGELLAAITSEPAEKFLPKLWVNYSRITFVNKLRNERVTIDLNLSFKNQEKELSLNDLVVAEVKQGRVTTESQFLKIMKNHGIRPGSISKYCLGVLMLHDEIKKNNFKAKLLAVNKIIRQPTN